MEQLHLKGNKPVAIQFISRIDQTSTNVLLATIMNEVNDGADEIVLMISTPGGSVSDGIAAYNSIRSLSKVNVIIYNLGEISSIGNVIYQAGNQRIAAENSNFMLHGVNVFLNRTLNLVGLEDQRNNLQNSQESIIKVLEQSSNYDAQELNEMFLREQHLSAEKALECGLTDKVADISLPSGVLLRPLVITSNT